MPDISVDIPGVGVVQFPDSMSPEEMNVAAQRLYREASAKAAGPNETLAAHKLRGPETLSDTPAEPSLMERLNRLLQPVAHPQTASDLLPLAIPGGVGMGVRGVEAAAQSIPTMEKAGMKFSHVMASAQKVPVDVNAAGEVALRIQQLAERGASMPQVVRKFLNRITDPEKQELLYEEGRDFASNISRLSADEFQRLTPVMKRAVGQLRATLDESLQRAASQVGKGDEYRGAMTEYRRAAQGREAWTAGKKVLVKGALGGSVAYGLGKASGLID